MSFKTTMRYHVHTHQKDLIKKTSIGKNMEKLKCSDIAKCCSHFGKQLGNFNEGIYRRETRTYMHTNACT